MKTLRIITLALVVIVFFINSAISQDINEIIKKSDEMYGKIQNIKDFEPLIKFLKDAEWNNKNNFELTWRIGRALSEKAVISYISFISDNMNSRKISDIDDLLDSDKKLESNQEGVIFELGKEGRYYTDKNKDLNSSRVESSYYEALSISMYGIGKSIVSALLEGISGKYQASLNNAIKNNRNYLEGAALRSYGRFYYVLPWPKRDYDESEKYLKMSVQAGPNNILNHLYLGDTYWRQDKKEEAKNEWKTASQISYTTTIERIILDKIKGMVSKRLSLN